MITLCVRLLLDYVFEDLIDCVFEAVIEAVTELCEAVIRLCVRQSLGCV